MSEDCPNRTEACGDCGGHEQDAADCRVKECLKGIRHKLVVMSGKGGVGKSTVAVNLATALALEGFSVGLLDVDLHGPSVPTMLGLAGRQIEVVDGRWVPVPFGAMKVLSIGFLLENGDDAVIWRGPVKMGVIKQFFSDVAWGALDYLVIDTPPGTGDEPLSVCQTVLQSEGAAAVIVTTPQEVSAADVRKSLNFCEKLALPVAGLIENMSGFVCPHCGEVTPVFNAGAGEKLAAAFHARLLGQIPLEPAVCQTGDAGTPFIKSYANTPAGKAFAAVVAKLTENEG